MVVVYNLAAPAVQASDAYWAAVKTIRSKARRAPYLSAASSVESKCGAFDDLAASQGFSEARSDAFDVEGLESQLMVDLYDRQFVPRKGVGVIRDAIKNAPPNELCPYCGEGRVTELDHYLPKSAYAGTTVHPWNLVPACHDCNDIKRAYAPGPSRPAVLHPYFDSAFNVPWLRAAVEDGAMGPVIEFHIDLEIPNGDLEGRLNAHMTVFGLRRRFSVWGAQSLDNFERYVRSEHGEAMTLRGAREHLERTALQQSGGRVNSWEGAAHQAMCRSDWYLMEHLGLS